MTDQEEGGHGQDGADQSADGLTDSHFHRIAVDRNKQQGLNRTDHLRQQHQRGGQEVKLLQSRHYIQIQQHHRSHDQHPHKLNQQGSNGVQEIHSSEQRNQRLQQAQKLHCCRSAGCNGDQGLLSGQQRDTQENVRQDLSDHQENTKGRVIPIIRQSRDQVDQVECRGDKQQHGANGEAEFLIHMDFPFLARLGRLLQFMSDTVFISTGIPGTHKA